MVFFWTITFLIFTISIVAFISLLFSPKNSFLRANLNVFSSIEVDEELNFRFNTLIASGEKIDVDILAYLKNNSALQKELFDDRAKKEKKQIIPTLINKNNHLKLVCILKRQFWDVGLKFMDKMYRNFLTFTPLGSNFTLKINELNHLIKPQILELEENPKFGEKVDEYIKTIKVFEFISKEIVRKILERNYNEFLVSKSDKGEIARIENYVKEMVKL
ncbi:hypothetical protein EDEG_02191 [Edhazardia aedis USNM 41457]|uniref:Uncharacterized protein n=1 Tax=Edhazardia aedis (strain USNM 41457) TaxID=1003232 RepID=J9D6R2_EDHAE|nr:hypothetical protein EDEG_02191 [Edhazardia aedis USNM 41457]|eukprot:EJW03471.1 hypothetical protein EDEG_02191 [Edhazardia aedis USNM 41457]